MASLLAGVIAMLGMVFAPEAQSAIEMRLTHPADPSHPVHLAAVRMVKRIEERTKGEVKIAIFPNNQLGAPPEAGQQVRLGVFVDAFVAYVEQQQMAPFFGKNRIADGVR